jgi:PAS domain S-box-containing protein
VAESMGHERERENILSWLAEVVRRGDYREAAQWLETLAAGDERFDFTGEHIASRWHERARRSRVGERLPDPLTVEGATADYRGLFGALLRHSFDGIVLNARESRLILEASESFCALTGYTREELIGRTSVELGLVADDERRAEVTGRADQGLEGLYETQLRRKDGEIPLVEFSHQLMPGNELVLTIARDVTNRRSSKEPLPHE